MYHGSAGILEREVLRLMEKFIFDRWLLLFNKIWVFTQWISFYCKDH